MEIWVIRSGHENKFANIFLSEGIIAIEYNKLENIEKIDDKEDLKSIYLKSYPGLAEWKGRTNVQVSQIWRFFDELKIGDFVLLPLKIGYVWIGIIESNYYYYSTNEPYHRRNVKWIRRIEKKSLDKDLYYSLGATLSIYRMKKRNVFDRILKAFEITDEPSSFLFKNG